MKLDAFPTRLQAVILVKTVASSQKVGKWKNKIYVKNTGYRTFTGCFSHHSGHSSMQANGCMDECNIDQASVFFLHVAIFVSTSACLLLMRLNSAPVERRLHVAKHDRGFVNVVSGV